MKAYLLAVFESPKNHHYGLNDRQKDSYFQQIIGIVSAHFIWNQIINLKSYHKTILNEKFEHWKMQLIDKLCVLWLINTNGRNSHVAEFEGLSYWLSMLGDRSLFEPKIFIFALRLLCVFRVLKRLLPYTINKRHY